MKIFGITIGEQENNGAEVPETPEEIEAHAKDLDAQSKLARAEASHADAMAKKYNAEAREVTAKKRHEAVAGKPKKKGFSLKNYKPRDLAIGVIIIIILFVALISRC